jgi:Family of unknown function (DUF5343)
VPAYPYTSGQGAIVQTFAQLRKGFPSKVDAAYLQRFGIAPANESYIISILRFLGFIDEEGDRRDESTGFFFGGDEDFKSGLEQAVRGAYSQLFGEMGEDALTAEKSGLTHWFRVSDKTSALVGQRQASTFQTLVALAGHGQIPAARGTGAKKPPEDRSTAGKKPAANKTADPKAVSKKVSSTQVPKDERGARTMTNTSDVGLIVRIEVNLPPGGDATTYDTIFASIKKHLMS